MGYARSIKVWLITNWAKFKNQSQAKEQIAINRALNLMEFEAGQTYLADKTSMQHNFISLYKNVTHSNMSFD